ncbi:hypothetical protein Ddc_00075 [Ditylenchus destructor]|nr:hypothetical protein Ddc_00075 [Ditylenchus destructor]
MYLPPYLPYLNFVENIIGFTDQAVAIGFFSHLMYCAFFVPKKLKVERLPRLMLMYMLNHLIFSCITIPYQAYMAIDWHVENAYNPYMIFWLGLTMNVYMVVTPLQKNRIIKFTIMAEILFNVLPAWSSALFNNLFADNIANYLGQYVGMCATCDAVMCSIVYSAIFLRSGLSFSRVSTVSTVSQSWATSSVSNKGSRS